MSSQRPPSPTSTRTPPARSSMSFAGLDSEVTRQTEDWVHHPATESRLARLALAEVRFDLPNDLEGLENFDIPLSPLRDYPRSIRSGSCGSSMAPALIHQSAPSAQAPSLISISNSCYTEATPTETSVSTGLANHLTAGFQLLEDNNGVLEVPRTQIRTPVFECAFWFLSCVYISHNQEEWTTHCESHFRGEDPPQTVQCPLCDWKWSHDDGRMSWNARMQHLALEHTMLGQTLRTSRPDFPLFHHLWRKRLIDDQDYKELLGGNHNLDRPPGNFVETNGRNGRREREGRRHRRQHVTAARPAGPPPPR